MGERRVANPRVLLPLAILAAFVFTMIAIFIAATYNPDTGRDGSTTPVTTTSTAAPPSR
jgi:hypothetical protein